MDEPPNSVTTYAMHGEDMAILRILERTGLWTPDGTYVDVGAFHPFWGSNTALLRDRGWRGVNVEPNPKMADALRRARPDDVTLQCAIGEERRQGELLYFYEWASSNTLVPEFAEAISSGQSVEVSERIPVDVVPLRDVLADHAPRPDVLSVDVEGMDFEVLVSNDWGRFRPSVVAVEDLGLELADPAGSATFQFMRAEGYRLVAHAVLTSIYLREPHRLL